MCSCIKIEDRPVSPEFIKACKQFEIEAQKSRQAFYDRNGYYPEEIHYTESDTPFGWFQWWED